MRTSPPAQIASAHPLLFARARVVQEIRAFFRARAFLEVDTPVALRAPAAEASIDAVPVAFAGNAQATLAPQQRFLQTSPELGMKRLVAQGLGDIFQLACVFRDGDASAVHAPEFRMLEWYRSHAPWTVLLDDCEGLLAHLSEVVRALPMFAHDEAAQARLTRYAQPFARIRVDAAFEEHAGIELATCTDAAHFARALQARGMHCQPTDSWADLFHRVFVGVVEPKLVARPAPFFLTHFPAPLASLAQLCADAPHVAERFELYAGGLELANGFGELRDAREQRARFISELDARKRAHKTIYPIDEAYLSCLASLPPTAGIALGVERLLMALLGVADIDAVSFLPWSSC